MNSEADHTSHQSHQESEVMHFSVRSMPKNQNGRDESKSQEDVASVLMHVP